jgi:hypothetical protein
MQITMTRDALLEKLTERFNAAKADDACAAKEHKAAEAKALQAFRARLREALKWDYERAKKEYFSAGLSRDDRPECPVLQQNDIKRQIEMVKLDQRKGGTYTISTGSDLYLSLMWKPKAEREPRTVCD